jgi:hypothetical protein
MTGSESLPESLGKEILNKKISRWLPRLDDASSAEVREDAAKILSSIAESEPELRDSLVPHLLNHCLKERSWPVICNGILYNLSSIPKQDPRWLEGFLDSYMQLAKTSDDVVFFGDTVREIAVAEIWGFIEEGMIDSTHPKMKEIAAHIEDRLSSRGDKAATGGEKRYLIKIQDWLEDC